MAYPTALDNFRTNWATGETLTAADFDTVMVGVNTLESKLGIGASTPTINTFLQGSGTGSSTWSALTSGQVTTALGYTPGRAVTVEASGGSPSYADTRTLRVAGATLSQPGANITLLTIAAVDPAYATLAKWEG